MNRLLRGAFAGAVATAPMTMLMEAMNRAVPREKRKPLPPRQITESLTHRATSRDPDEDVLDAAAMAAHFGFGAGAGAAFEFLPDRVRRRPVFAGIGFGLALWAASYAGVLPAFELQRRPEHRPGWRNATMIAGHLMWGAVLGAVEQELRRRDEEPSASGSDRDALRHRFSGAPSAETEGPADMHW